MYRFCNVKFIFTSTQDSVVNIQVPIFLPGQVCRRLMCSIKTLHPCICLDADYQEESLFFFVLPKRLGLEIAIGSGL